MSAVPERWRQDACLRALQALWDEVDLVSLDVFDTLLLRTCTEPADVFVAAGARLEEELPGLVPSAPAFRSLRREAESRARARKGPGHEVTFDEILAELPWAPEVRDVVRRLEIEQEARSVYLNPSVAAVVRDGVARGKRVVLTSDTYWASADILSLVARCGLDVAELDGCFVSSERGVTKGAGELFRQVLAAFPEARPERVVHIGDSERADVAGAERAGFRSIHYAVVPPALGDAHDVERVVYGVELGEIRTLRRLAAATHPHAAGSEEEALHRIGASVLGPVYALFADWVVQHAEARGLSVVLPLMREGELLARVIARAAEAAGSDLRCTPAFLSRQPAFIASIGAANYVERISQSLLRAGRTVGALFGELGLDLASSRWSAVDECPLEELAREDKRALETHLLSGPVRTQVVAHGAAQRALLLRYLEDLTGGEPALTVDIGTKGTTERYLHELAGLVDQVPPLAHALAIGSAASNVDNLLAGIDITAWLGIAGENADLIGRLMYQMPVLETLVNATCGTTLAYEERDGAVVPVLGQERVGARQQELIRVCWAGIESFQRHWLELAAAKPGLRRQLLGRQRDLLGVLLRFIDAPQPDEVEAYSAFDYVDGFNVAEPRALVESYWPQAAEARRDPARGRRLFLERLEDDATTATMLRVADAVHSNGLRGGAVFGTSELGRRFQRLAGLLEVPLTTYVDSDRRLHGSVIDGLEVRPLADIRNDVDFFVIASQVYGREMRSMLEAHYPEPDSRPAIFDLGSHGTEVLV